MEKFTINLSILQYYRANWYLKILLTDVLLSGLVELCVTSIERTSSLVDPRDLVEVSVEGGARLGDDTVGGLRGSGSGDEESAEESVLHFDYWYRGLNESVCW